MQFTPILILLSASSPEPFGTERTLSFGINSLGGYRIERSTETDNDRTDKRRGFYLLSPAPLSTQPVLSGSADYFLAPNFSMGALIAYSNTRTSTQFEDEEDSRDGGSFTGARVGGRLGYVFGMQDSVQFWAKAGLSYFRFSIRDRDDDDRDTLSGGQANFEFDMVVNPVPHVSFTVGPFYDLPLFGGESFTDGESGREDDGDDFDISALGVDFGVQITF